MAAWKAVEKERAEEKAKRHADLEAARAEYARLRRADQIRAGIVYEPLGGWDFDGSDALAAVFSSPFVWDCIDKRGDGPILDVHDFALLYVCLGLISENGGEEVRVRVDRFPRLPDEWHGDRSKMLAHLEANGLLELDRRGVHVTIRRGPARVHALRRSYAKQWAERARGAG